jgi:branched-chain amino acid transport system permease protein
VTLERALRLGPGLLVVFILALAPLIFSDFYLSAVITKALWLGIAAVSLIFLAGYVGMVSLGQVALYGIAGFTAANLVEADGGSKVALNPWAATLLGLIAAVAVGFLLGAIGSRSYGIYFLMITLASSVLVYFFFAQVTQLSGFGGVNNVELPSVVGNPLQQPARLFYIALAVSAIVYLGLRYITRAPLGLAFQGVRDDPARMRALGYNVPLLRMVAFALGALVAGLAGVLSVWWNTRISPGSISLSQTIDLLVIAVIGGLYRLEGAWVGAVVVTVLDNWLRGVDLVGNRFNTVIGAVFLAIVLISPGGLMGIWDSLMNTLQSRFARGGTGEEPEVIPLTQEAHSASDRPIVP